MLKDIAICVASRMARNQQSLIAAPDNKGFALMLDVMFFTAVIVSNAQKTLWPDANRFFAKVAICIRGLLGHRLNLTQTRFGVNPFSSLNRGYFGLTGPSGLVVGP